MEPRSSVDARLLLMQPRPTSALGSSTALPMIEREVMEDGKPCMREREKHTIALTQEHVLLHVKMRFYKSL